MIRCRSRTRRSTARSTSRRVGRCDASRPGICGPALRSVSPGRAPTAGRAPGCIAGMVMISERPPEVADRAVPGHWEGDLLMGTRDTAIATVVERQTRYCQLVALPDETNAEPVCEALNASIITLPVQLRRSLTWDQGKEIAAHRRFSIETGVEIYFCDPRSPWQRHPASCDRR